MDNFIHIEKRNYPRAILGDDSFTGWFNKKSQLTEKKRIHQYSEVLEQAYSMGVKGFVDGGHEALNTTLRKFRETHREVVCIANNHFKSCYYYKKESLWKSKHRAKLIATMLSRTYAPIQVNWFNQNSTSKTLLISSRKLTP